MGPKQPATQRDTGSGRERGSASTLPTEVLQGIVDSAMDAIISIDERYRIIVFNAAAEQMFGYAASEVLGGPLDRLIPAAFRNVHSSHIARFGATGTTRRSMRSPGTLLALRADGQEFPIEAAISQMSLPSGKAFTAILRDISLRKEAEKSVAEKARLLDMSSDAIIVRDSSDRIIYWNRGASAMYGFAAEEALGQVPHDLLHTEFPHSSAEALRQLQDRGNWDGELTHTGKDGQKITVSSRWLRNRDEASDNYSVLETNRDITTWKQAQEALVRSEKLASAGRMAATVSHEINNPLAIITNSVYLASLDPNLSEEARKHLTVAEQELERVAQLTRQTLGFYRENTAPEKVDLGALAETVVGIYRPKLIDRKIEAIVESDSRRPVRAVAGEIRQVLSNLLSNAIDACSPGDRIYVRTKSVPLRGQLATSFTVADTGEGISKENMKRVFEPFFTTKQSVGTGLGLWLCRQIVERHGGTLRVRSRRSHGTVFTVFFPQGSNIQDKG